MILFSTEKKEACYYLLADLIFQIQKTLGNHNALKKRK